jgi:hypothetical protein
MQPPCPAGKPAKCHALAFNQLLIIVGVLLAIAMFAYQVWRVQTGQFTPTIREFIVDPLE